MPETATEPTIRLFLLVANRLLRESLNRLCRKRGDLQVVGQSGCEEDAIPRLLDSRCDVVALDFLDVRFLCSLSCCSRRESVEIKTVLIGMQDDPQPFLGAVHAGALGYLLRDASANDVIAAIRAVYKREAVCPPRLCAALFERFGQIPYGRQKGGTGPHLELTLRQQQLVSLVAKGLTNKEVAAQLNLSEFTVRNHLHRIMKQIDAGSRREVVRAIFDHMPMGDLEEQHASLGHSAGVSPIRFFPQTSHTHIR
jgi:two-component system NarL family response regulator